MYNSNSLIFLEKTSARGTNASKPNEGKTQKKRGSTIRLYTRCLETLIKYKSLYPLGEISKRAVWITFVTFHIRLERNVLTNALPDFSPSPCGRFNMPWEKSIQCALASRCYSRNLIRMHFSHAARVYVRPTHACTWLGKFQRVNLFHERVLRVFLDRRNPFTYPRITLKLSLSYVKIRYFFFNKKSLSADHIITFSQQSSRLAKEIQHYPALIYNYRQTGI